MPRNTFRITIIFAMATSAWLVLTPEAALAQDRAPTPQRARLAARPATVSLCDVDPAAHAVEDVRGRLARMETRSDGAFTISRAAPGLRLVGIVRDGAVREYAVVDDEGRPVPNLTTPAAATDDCNPCCWKCGKATDGKVHCWQLDCPVIISSGEDDEG